MEFTRGSFLQLLEQMAVPKPMRGNKDQLYFPFIFPLVSENKIEWLARDELVVWVQAPLKLVNQISEPRVPITEPFRIPIDAAKMIHYLKKGLRKTKDTDSIFFIHDPDNGIQILTNQGELYYSNGRWNDLTQIKMLITAERPYRGIVRNQFPETIDPDTEIILFDNEKPAIIGSLDKARLVDILTKYKGSNYNIKVEKGKNYIIFHQNIANELSEFKTRCTDLEGSGELHFNRNLLDIANVLDGEFQFYSINQGPLYIMNDIVKENYTSKARYLIYPIE